VVGRLVEQQQVGARHQRPREVEPHAPAAGEARDRIAVARLGEAQPGEELRSARPRAVALDRLEALMQLGEPLARSVRIGLRVGERSRRRAELRIAIEDVFDRGGLRRCRLLAHVRDDPGRRQEDLAGVRVELAQEQREE
jgi:hypothetical protein